MGIYGLSGHAVIEGLSLSGHCGRVLAVRDEFGFIVYDKQYGHQPEGPVASVRALARELLWSARQAGLSEDEPLKGYQVFFSLLFSLLLAGVIFLLLPVAAAYVAGSWLHPALCCLLEGVLRCGLLLLYLLRVSRFNDIKRWRGYQGALSKVLQARALGLELNTEQLRRVSRCDRRDSCALTLATVFVLILIFAFLNRLNWTVRVPLKLALLLLAGLLASRLHQKLCQNPEATGLRLLLAPVLIFCRLTTRTPDDYQLTLAALAWQELPVREQEAEAAVQPTCALEPAAAVRAAVAVSSAENAGYGAVIAADREELPAPLSGALLPKTVQCQAHPRHPGAPVLTSLLTPQTVQCQAHPQHPGAPALSGQLPPAWVQRQG